MTQEPYVLPGYKIGRDSNHLTARERQVLGRIAQGMSLVDAAKEIGVSKQRVDQIVKSLVKKGALTRDGRQFIVRIERVK